MNPILTPKEQHKNTTVRLMEWFGSMRYGTLFGVWISMAMFFGVLYFALSFIGEGQHAPTALYGDPIVHRAFNALYYSIITATSTGYGDITPQGFSKVLACLQSISALFVFAVFVTKLVSHQQEMTLSEVHRLTFEDIFHNTREGLFICRKDFDHIIKDVTNSGKMSEESWANLTTAYKQLQSLFEEIPDFYENEIHSYTIDKRREQLLLEGAHRTLHRINQVLDTLSSHNINWVAHEESMNELQDLAKIVTSITPLWKERSPYEATEAFADILQMKERMHQKITRSIS